MLSQPEAKPRVFLVEDHDDTRFVLAYLLTGSGYDVREASTLQAALRDFPRSGCDVLVSDVGLPDGSGLDLMRELRRSGSFPYAIALSGFGGANDVAASLAVGFRHHLVKPVRTEALERLLEEAFVELGVSR